MSKVIFAFTVFLLSLWRARCLFDRDIRQSTLQLSCPQECFNKEKYRTVQNREMLKAKHFLRRFAEGNSEGLLINLAPEKWGNYCQEIDNIKTCLSRCTLPSDQAMLQITQACVTLAADIVCNEDIKSSMNCVTEVSNQQSDTCKLKCNHHKQAFVKTYKAFTASRPISPDDPDKAIEGLCRLINCRLFCRKDDIIRQCNTAGFEAAKSIVRAVGRFFERFSGEDTPNQLVGPVTISGHCTEQKLVEPPA